MKKYDEATGFMVSEMNIDITYRDQDMLYTLCDSQESVDVLYAEITGGGRFDSNNQEFIDLGQDPAEAHWERKHYANGFTEEFWETQRCNSSILIPGTSLMNRGLTGFIYLIWLGWMFVGIAIVSDIFMESIEAITAQT